MPFSGGVAVEGLAVSRDYEPQAGQWYEDLDNEEAFQVLAVDPDEEIIRIQWPDREIREIDLDQWNEMDLELAVAPEGWVDDVVKDDAEDDEEDEDDWEDEEDEDDDWDDDEDEDEDDDLDEDDDEYRDRE
jgi:segregation and condensation protein B